MNKFKCKGNVMEMIRKLTRPLLITVVFFPQVGADESLMGGELEERFRDLQNSRVQLETEQQEIAAELTALTKSYKAQITGHPDFKKFKIVSKQLMVANKQKKSVVRKMAFLRSEITNSRNSTNILITGVDQQLSIARDPKTRNQLISQKANLQIVLSRLVKDRLRQLGQLGLRAREIDSSIGNMQAQIASFVEFKSALDKRKKNLKNKNIVARSRLRKTNAELLRIKNKIEMTN